MCGIAGSLRSDWDVEAALDAIAHRGPDGRAVATAGDAVHGHVRLAIMDPEPRSDCPFVYEDVTLSYVGECWNFRELRAELEAEGLAFATEGDTEVVAAALWRWDAAALERIEGQYAFAWTDARTGATSLARDRFGEVPLYTRAADATLFGDPGITWASERKAWGAEGAEADPVPAGTVWTLDARPEPYYEAASAARRREPPAHAADVRAALELAVRRRLQSDVPVCCLVSGGVDSSSILALAKRSAPGIVAYTAAFEDSADLAQARAVTDALGVELHEVPVPAPGEAELAEAIRAVEITMKAQVEIALHCLPLAERIYADGYRVVLSGEGADELFGGYGTLVRHSKRNGGRDWPLVRLAGVEKMARGNFVRINKAFMAHGVEARTPFMDRDLVEAVLPLYRDECPEQKLLLREAVAGLVPEETRLRPKVSFQSGSGMRGWLEGDLDGRQQVTYNRIAREAFGGLPRG